MSVLQVPYILMELRNDEGDSAGPDDGLRMGFEGERAIKDDDEISA